MIVGGFQMASSKGRQRLARVLQHGGEWVTVDDAAAALRVDRVTAAKLLARWQQQGWLARVRRGLYVAVSLSASPSDQVLEDAWSLVPELFDPAYVGGASAAQHWGLTEQLFRSVFVYTVRPVRRTKQTIHGAAFVIRHISEDRLFGTTPLWRGRIKIQLSDIHRTIIDMLDEPAAGGGIRHVSECLKTYLARRDAEPSKLINYADRLGNGAVFKRLGFLTELYEGPATLVNACTARQTQGVVKLDPAVPSPRLLRRWRLWLPDRWKMEEAAND